MKNNKIILLVISLLVIVCILSSIIFINKGNDYNGKKFNLDNNYYSSGKFIDITKKDLKRKINNKSTFLLYTYNSYCNLPIPCENIFSVTMKKYNIDVLQIPIEEFRETNLYKTVKLAPSLVIIKNGKIVDYLKADKDEDLDKYQNIDEFEKWLSSYIILDNS